MVTTPVMTQRVMTEPEPHGHGEPLYVHDVTKREYVAALSNAPSQSRVLMRGRIFA